MDIVDELVTPGCPQCAIKHLSSALSYLSEHCATEVPTSDILVARAIINLEEAAVGYKSHFFLGLGLLERAERVAVTEGWLDNAHDIRETRVMLIQEGAAGLEYAASTVATRHATSDGAMMWAHLWEAKRESGSASVLSPDPEVILSTILSIDKEYFNSYFTGEKGGEDTMACNKKAKCAAAKGGKAAVAKKAPCKGKCKK